MGKFVIAVVGLFVLTGIAAPAQATQGVAKKYSSCSDLLKKYPDGVAKDKKARNKAVKGGFAKPKVSKSLYSTNGSRLDRDKDGVMCEQEAMATPDAAPIPVPVPTIQPATYEEFVSSVRDGWYEKSSPGIYDFLLGNDAVAQDLYSEFCSRYRLVGGPFRNIYNAMAVQWAKNFPVRGFSFLANTNQDLGLELIVMMQTYLDYQIDEGRNPCF